MGWYRPDVQRKMTAQIPESQLILCPDYGHGNYQENPYYGRQVDLFVSKLYGANR